MDESILNINGKGFAMLKTKLVSCYNDDVVYKAVIMPFMLRGGDVSVENSDVERGIFAYRNSSVNLTDSPNVSYRPLIVVNK